MGEVKDRVVFRLPVDAVQRQLARRAQPVEHHLARQPHRGQLRRIAEQDQRRENLAQIVELALVQHGAFVDQTDIQRLFPPLPALDEIRSAQPGRGQRAGDRRNLIVEGFRAVQCQLCQPFDRGARAIAGQPFGYTLILRVIDRGVQDAVDRRCRHAAQPQHRGRLVGGGQDGQRAAVLALASLVIPRDDVDTRRRQRLVQAGQQHRLARPCLAHHRQNRGLALGLWRDRACGQVHTHALQLMRQAIPGFGLIFGQDGKGHGHGATLRSSDSG